MAIINGVGRVGVRVTSGAPSGGGTDVDAQAFITAASLTDSTQISAVNTLVTGLKSAGIWSKMKALYPFVGGNATAHSKNLINPSLYNLTFSSGWNHTNTGAKPNGTSAYANTSLLPSSVLNVNSTHVSAYSREDNSNNGSLLGVFTFGARGEISIFPKYGGSTLYYAVHSNEGGVSNSDSRGLFLANRTSNSQMNGWRNGTKLITSNQNVQTIENVAPITLSALNYGSSRYYFSPNELAIATIGDGLTDTEASTLYTLVQAFQTTLGRQV